jgi:hypothetical protein
VLGLATQGSLIIFANGQMIDSIEDRAAYRFIVFNSDCIWSLLGALHRVARFIFAPPTHTCSSVSAETLP